MKKRGVKATSVREPGAAAEELITQAMQRLQAGQPGPALALCEQVLTAAPDLVAAHVYKGIALRRQSRFEAALESIQHAVELDPANPASHEQLGISLIDLNRAQPALEAFHRALALDDTRLVAWVNVGNVEMGRREFGAAETAYRRALALNPNVAHCYQNLCWLLRRVGRVDEAVAAGRRAIELAPGNITAYNYLTFAELARDDCEAALELCESSLELDPGNTASLAYKPTALHLLGRSREGRALVDVERLVQCRKVEAAPGYERLADFNRELAEFVVTCPTRPYDDTQTVDLLAAPEGPVRTLKTLIDETLRRYLAALPDDPAHPFLCRKPRRWVLDGWATLLDSMEVQEHHFHQHGWVSGVYYVRVPEFIGAAGSANAGFIEFCRFPRYGERPVESEFALFQPFEGMLVVFPSYFYHRVVEFPPSERRISFAFNVTPVA